MNSASQPDSPSEWSKFAPLPPRLRSNSPVSATENLAVDTPSSETAATETAILQDPQKSPLAEGETIEGARGAMDPTAFPTDQFICQNRKCQERSVSRKLCKFGRDDPAPTKLHNFRHIAQERRERHHLAPRLLFGTHWRALKIGKRQSLVVDLAVVCPDCEREHVYTLVPPEWLEAIK